MSIWTVSTFWLLWLCYNEHLYQVFICVSFCSYFVFKPRGWNTWFIWGSAFSFIRTVQLFSRVAAPLYFATIYWQGFQSLPILTNTSYFLFFFLFHKMAYQCGFDLHFPNMPANWENSAVATGLEKVSFHSNPKERQCQRMLKLPHNCTNLTC